VHRIRPKSRHEAIAIFADIAVGRLDPWLELLICGCGYSKQAPT